MLRRSQLIIFGVLGVLVIVGVLLYFGIIPGLRQTEVIQPVTLNFWGVSDDRTVFSEIFADYEKQYPYVRINYRQFTEDRYEEELVNALAAGEVIDVAMIRNSWLPKHFDKLKPLAGATAFVDFQNLYPTVAVQDFAPDKIVYALPLSIDTLAMIYNRDIFDAKGIAIPPRNWVEFQNVVAKLKKPVAIGGTNKSIKYASDLIQALFVQAGVPMVDEHFTRAVLAPSADNPLAFYAQFSNPKSPYYSWSDNFSPSLDSFAQGQTAIIFGYQNELAEVRDRNPSLRFGIAPFPQPAASTQPVTWARYYGLAVPNNSHASDEAWRFASFLASQETEAAKYQAATGRPPALRSLIRKFLDHESLGVFAQQALTARSYPQVDDTRLGEIFSNMIESVITGRLAPFSAVIQAEAEITKLIQRRKQ